MKTYLKNSKAFGLINMLVTLAVVAIIGSIAYVAMTGVKDSAEEQLLHDQVVSLNRSVKLYLNSGGSIDGLNTAQSVIDKMKTIASNGEKIAGYRGAFIDPRLQAVEQSDEEASSSSELRVIWDPAAQSFEIAAGGVKGIKEFKVETIVTPDSIPVEEREIQFELSTTNSQGSWVWDFDSDASISISPLAATADHDTNLDIDPNNTNFAKSQLIQPTISPAPATTDKLPLADFGTTGKPVVVSDPNSEEHSQLYVSVSGDIWQAIDSGATVSVAPGGNVAAFASVKEASEHLYYSSYVRAARFDATEIALPAPTISTSAPEFHPVETETITVTVNAIIPTEGNHKRGQIMVKVGGADWGPYNDTPFSMDIDSYTAGVTVRAKVSPTQWANYYTETEGNPATLTSVVVDLEAPTIDMAYSSFHTIDRQSLKFTLTDRNIAGAAGMHKLMYSLDGGANWEDYEDEVTLSLLDHLNLTPILAKALPTVHVANFNESPEANESLTIENAILSSPQIASQYPVLNPQGYPSSTITLTDTNLSSLSKLLYSTDDGANWTAYDTPFTVTFAEFPEGVTILAKAEPILLHDYLTASGHSSNTLPIPPKLDAPNFNLTPGDYVMSVLSSSVSLDDDNSAGESTLRYRVNDGTWTDYQSEDGVEWSAWLGPNANGDPSAPRVVEAQAKATDYMTHRDSDVVSGTYRRIWLTPDLAFSVSSSGIPSSVHQFTGSSEGEFTAYVAESSSTVAVLNGNTFSWGTGDSSWLSYDGLSWEGMQAGEMFRIGTLDYYNGEIDTNTGASEVTLDLAVELVLPDATEVFDISMALDNTINTYEVQATADYVTIGNLVNDFSTEIDGIEYSLNLAFGYHGTNGFNTVDQFHVHEEVVATADLWGYFTSDEF